MYTILIKNVVILDKFSSYHLQKTSIYIVNDVIKSIGNDAEPADKIIDANGNFASVGWIDMRTFIGEPGLEHKENIVSVCKAAAFGGFTAIVSLPNTIPVVQAKETLSYILQNVKNELVDIFPLAAATTNTKGEELTEMMELHQHGAIAFSDAENCISHPGLLIKALQYIKPFNGLIIQHAEEKNLTQFGQMNEGITSTYLGLKGLPSIAEELVIKRDIELLQYAGTGRLHFSRISTKNTVNLIKISKQKGLNITCDVAIAHLVLDDTALLDFDTNFKLNPPLRTKEDQNALWNGLMEGIIDVIVTDHHPQDKESKNLEFDMAENGMIALETAIGLLLKHKPIEMDIAEIIEKITINPRKILGISQPSISENEIANITIFDANKTWTFSESDIKSKSKNTPFVGTTLQGKVIGVINKNKIILQ